MLLLLNKLNKLNMYCVKYRNKCTTIDILYIFNKNLNDYILFKKQQHKDIMELENKKYTLETTKVYRTTNNHCYCDCHGATDQILELYFKNKKDDDDDN